MFNFYEERKINNKELPLEWQDEDSLNKLELFLQENWKQKKYLYNDDNKESNQQFLTFLSHNDVKTNNYIGAIGFKGQVINVFPKVFRKEKYFNNDTSHLDDGQMIKNLITWINYCNKIDYPFINFPSDIEKTNNFKDLFISIYIRYIEQILDKNTFYSYELVNEDLPVIRGKFNLNDYFTKKMPQGKLNFFNCEFSVFEYDNILNRIIKYVCKMVFNSTNFQNQTRLRNILSKLCDVTDVKCSSIDCDKIILNKSQLGYKVILSMSKMFLMNQFSTFRIKDNNNFCFLFPSEFLFEGFIGGFLKEMLKEKADVYLQKSEHLFEHFFLNDSKNEDLGKLIKLRYDIFIKDKKTNKLFIFDTKYKMLPDFNNLSELKDELGNEMRSSDIYQVLEYANKNDLQDVFLLYPLIRNESITNNHVVGQCNVQKQVVNVHIVKVPFVFEEDEENMKNILKNELMKLLN